MKSRTVQASAAALGDKPCIYCGTELRGLTAHDVCPHCGKPAVDSLLQNYLRDADHGWLRVILRGITLTAVAYGVMIASAALGVVRVFVRAEYFDVTVYRNVANLAAMTLLAVGTWFLTAREPADSLVARRRLLAWLARLATVLSAAGLGLMPFSANVPPQVMKIAIGAGVAGLILGYLLPWIHLRRLNDRTPRKEVSRLLRWMLWLSVVLIALTVGSLAYGTYVNPAIHGYLPMAHSLVWAAHHVFAIYVLITTSKGIRRTVGYWT